MNYFPVHSMVRSCVRSHSRIKTALRTYSVRVVFRGRGYRKGDKQETSTQIINRALPDLLSVIRDGVKTVIWEGQERGEGRGEQRRKQRQESENRSKP